MGGANGTATPTQISNGTVINGSRSASGAHRTQTHSTANLAEQERRRVSRLLLGSLLFLALGGMWYYWLVHLGADENSVKRMNHWWWTLGPQLDYLHGPPPH